MRGWLFAKTGVEPELIEKEDPKAAPGEVVLKVKAAGLCHSDVGALKDPGWMNLITGAPVIFGHECAGEIAELGEGVTGWEIGDRVGVAPIDPDTGDTIGYQRDGGYSTRLSVPAKQLVKIPEGVSYVQGAAATDAGMTSHHAIFHVGGAKAGMKVGIIGVGGLGQMAVQMAVAEGCEVYAADTSEAARAIAEEAGATKVYADAKDMAADGIDLIVDYAGFPATFAAAQEAVNPGGTIVLVGMGALELPLNGTLVITKMLQVKGSMGGTTKDIEGVYEYFAKDQLHPQLETIGFEEIGEGLKRLERHEVAGRLVAEVNE